MHHLKVTAVGDSLAIVLPPEIAARLGVEDGSPVSLIETSMGYFMTTLEPMYAEQVNTATEGLVKYRDALKELAE